MKDINAEQERNMVDIVTDSMFSLSFLQGITNIIFSPQKDKFTVGQFYNQWIEETDAKEMKIPFSLGAIVGYCFCGLVVTKEHWYDLLPDDDIYTKDPSWGMSDVSCYVPQRKNPSIKYIIRRMRNAIGHGHLSFNIPKKLKDRSKIMTSVTIELNDINSNDPSDTFQIVLTLDQMSKIIKKFHSVVHRHVRSKV